MSSRPAPKTAERNDWLTVPNVLTFFRLLAIIPFAFFAMQGKDRAALGIYLAAGLTDAVDGVIARRLGQESKIGRLLDPVTDKVFTGVAYVVLAAFRGELSKIPEWLMAAVLLRDLLIMCGSLIVYNASRNSGFKPSAFGKFNTLLEISVVVGFLGQRDVWLFRVLLPSAYVVLLISLAITTGDYLRTGLRMMRVRTAGE